MDIAVQDALIGRLVDGRYRVRARIARGGMATVYEASDERLNRDVALKVMHPDLAEDDEFVARFISEARAAAALSRDRTIVTVYDQGASDGIVWLALELVRGRTLRSLILQRGRLDQRTALAVIEPVLTALAAAHDAGIVHRDVKPENVLVGDDGHIQVSDFGLAHAVSGAPAAHRSTRGVLLGTVAYISPEQALGHPATQASDVYSAGVLLYELLTGHPPHDGPTDYVIVRKHVDEDVPVPSSEVAGISAEVDALVARATARSSADRFSEAGAFLGAVRRTRAALAREPGGRDTGPLTPVVGATAAAAGAAAAHGVHPDGTRRSDTNPIHHSTTALDPLPGPPTGQTTLPPSPVHLGEDPFRTPPPAPKRRRRGRRTILVLALLAAVAAGAWWWFDGRLVQTPSLVGMTVADAERMATQAGLSVGVTDEAYSETIPAEAVVATDPEAGASVVPGATVGLVISLGPERYQVPDLTGATRQDAEAALGDLTLVPGEVTEEFSESVPADQVISQQPEPGTEVKRAAEVSFVVSKGRQPIEVPAVVGTPRDEAVAAIEDVGLSPQVGEAFSDEVERGRVISQDPADGTLFRDDPVSIVVSLGPETVQVPDVEGQDADEAEAALRALGLEVRSIVLLPAGPNGVLRQAPAAGSTVRVGSEVTIYVF